MRRKRKRWILALFGVAWVIVLVTVLIAMMPGYDEFVILAVYACIVLFIWFLAFLTLFKFGEWQAKKLFKPAEGGRIPPLLNGGWKGREKTEQAVPRKDEQPEARRPRVAFSDPKHTTGFNRWCRRARLIKKRKVRPKN
jgi:hypothetical protein